MANIHQQFFEFFNKRDFEAMRTLMHSEYSYTGPDGNELTGGPEVGIGVAKMYTSAFPDCTVEVRKVYEVGNVSVCEFFAHGTHGGDFLGHAPTGRPVAVNVCNVIELRDGKAYREREYMDMLGFLAQIGAIELPAAATATH
jgi:steroid delta-isomerase-like uncharacterized protein